MIAYKFLRAHGSSVFSGIDWPLPSDGPGAWVEAPPDPCRSGLMELTVDTSWWTRYRSD